MNRLGVIDCQSEKVVKYSESQIIKSLKGNERGRKSEDIYRELGIHKGYLFTTGERSIQGWKQPSQLRRLKELEEETDV